MTSYYFPDTYQPYQSYQSYQAYQAYQVCQFCQFCQAIGYLLSPLRVSLLMSNHLILPAGFSPVPRQRYRLAAASLLTLALHGGLLGWLCHRATLPPPLPLAQPMVMLAVAERAESAPDSEKMPTGVRQQQAVAQAQATPPPPDAPKLAEAANGSERLATSSVSPVITPAIKPQPKPVPKPVRQPNLPQSVPTEASAAPVTSAPPPMAGKTLAAPRNQAAAQPARAASAWSGALLAHLSRFKRYPAIALRQKREGIAQIGVTLDRQGRVLAVKLLQSSGVSALDKEASDLPLRASPVPAPPAEMAAGQETFSITLPVRFDLREVRG